MTQTDKAARFKALHVKGDPLVLYNIWDTGGAKTLEKAGAKAVATGSFSIAAAHGFDDGEAVPLEFLLQVVARIADTVDVPLSVDFEGGYAADPEGVAQNVRRVTQAGAVGINLEDQIVGTDRLYPIADQVVRIRAARQGTAQDGTALVLNARTDVFLKAKPDGHAALINDAITRAVAYAEAGADSFFVPGLTDLSLINQIVEATSLPVNVMMMGELTSIHKVAEAGVARASYGPGPYLAAMLDLSARFKALE